MFKLLLVNLKMMVRGRQALFWSLFFPLMFTIIFGFFFGGESTNVGTVALINQSNTNLAQDLEKAINEAKLFKIQKETDIEVAKDQLKKNKITAIIEIPKDFGKLVKVKQPSMAGLSNGSMPSSISNIMAKPVFKMVPSGPKEINLISDPANAQSNAVISGFLNQFVTSVNFKFQNAKPIYSVKIESSADKSLTYFDFVLVGMIGLALMNASVQGIAIPMAKYREDRILKRITTTPLPSWKFVFAEVLARLVQNIAQISLVLSVGIFFFNAHIVGNIFLLLFFALIGGLLFQAIGFAVASVAKTTDAAQGMSIAITIPMMFLAGVFFPIDQLPKWLFSIVQYLPLAPLLRMLRQIGLESLSPLTNPANLAIVGGWIVIMLAISIWRFRLSEE